MKYTEEQLNFIQEKRPELKKKAQPSLNTVIVLFLKKYEVYVKPRTTAKVTSGDITSGAVAGAIGGLAGADVGGDAVIIGGQKKQTEVQEWTQWKQWALNHKDFPKFQTDLLNKIDKFNKNIDKKLNDPEYQKSELNPLIEKKEKNDKLINRLVLIFLALVIGGGIIGNIYIYLEDKNDQSSLIKKY